MRWCDRWLGKPAAFLVWMLSPFLHCKTGIVVGEKIPDVRRIRVIKLFGMGSLLLGTPSFRALRRAYPEASFEIVTSATHLPFLQTLGIFDRIYGVSLRGIRGFLRDIQGLLCAPPPDISINLEYYTWMALVLQTIQRSRVRVAFSERQWLRLRLLDISVHFNHQRHIRGIFGEVAEKLGARMSSYELSPITVQKDDTEIARESLSRNGFSFDRTLIAMHIGVSPLCPLRQWPLEHFRELLGAILERTDAVVVLVGGPEEKDEADIFAAFFPGNQRLINLVGVLSIPSTLALLRISSMLITNDSGLLHWAVALNTPTISFFGPETPRLYGPPLIARHRVFYSGRSCSPCMTTARAKFSKCRDNLCLKEISAAEVFEAVNDFITRGKAGDGGLPPGL